MRFRSLHTVHAGYQPDSNYVLNVVCTVCCASETQPVRKPNVKINISLMVTVVYHSCIAIHSCLHLQGGECVAITFHISWNAHENNSKPSWPWKCPYITTTTVGEPESQPACRGAVRNPSCRQEATAVSHVNWDPAVISVIRGVANVSIVQRFDRHSHGRTAALARRSAQRHSADSVPAQARYGPLMRDGFHLEPVNHHHSFPSPVPPLPSLFFTVVAVYRNNFLTAFLSLLFLFHTCHL